MPTARRCAPGQTAWIGFGHGEIDWAKVEHDAVVFKNDDPKLNRRLRQTFSGEDPVRRSRSTSTSLAETAMAPCVLVGNIGQWTTGRSRWNRAAVGRDETSDQRIDLA